jgi:hypothetical protein
MDSWLGVALNDSASQAESVFTVLETAPSRHANTSCQSFLRPLVDVSVLTLIESQSKSMPFCAPAPVAIEVDSLG